MSDTHAESIAFVQREQIPPAPPPATERGPVKWVRANLISSPANAVLTVLAILAIWWILSSVLPWILNGVWNAESLNECRAILEGRTGACFAVLADRWSQLIFGRYPSNLYWRPVVAFLLAFPAFAPVLYPMLPRWMLVFTGLFPFAAQWLIWGGSILGPLTLIAAIALGYVAFTYLSRRSFALGLVGGVIAAILAGVLLSALIGELFNVDGPSDVNILDLRQVQSRDIGGFMLNLILGITGLTLALPLGILLALGRQSRMPIVTMICVIFIEFVRGVPLITLLFVANVVLAYFLPPGTNFDLVIRVIIMITMFAAAYIAEVIRGGLAALPRGQYEGADSLGLSYWQSMRLIILPQALKISIPGIVNTFIGLFKDTTLVVFIGLLDPIGFSNAIRATTEWNGIYWELFVFIGVLFFVFCYSMGRYSLYLEKKLSREHR